VSAIILFLLLLQDAAPPQIQSPGAGNLADNGPKIDLEKAKAFKPQRTEFGHPNLEGIWQPRTSGAAYSVLPHPGGFFLGQGSETGIVEGGVLPYQPWAAEQVKYRREHVELDPTGHCHYEGVPHALYFTFQIIQTPSKIAFVHENMHAWRIVYLTGEHPKDYSAPGWAIRAHTGKGTRWLSTLRTTMTKVFLIWPVTSTAINCTSSNDTLFKMRTC